MDVLQYLWCDPLPHPGWLNMGIDAALLERADRGERWLRLYAWEPTLSFGRHEPAARRYDRTAIEASALAVVRRPTGGRAVWHAGELTYAVAAPVTGLGSLREAYQRIHLVLRDALRQLGAPAELARARGRQTVDAGACFAGSAGGEVEVHGRKIVGSAQLRHNGALLQHGSVLLDGDQSPVARVTLGGAAPDRSTTLLAVLGRPVAWTEAAAAVTAAVSSWKVIAPPSPAALFDVLARGAELGVRFRSPGWTWDGAAAADATRATC
jgi:lipoyl(octanoyl) transferase